MKRFSKIPSCLAIVVCWMSGLAAHAQINTQSYYAELHNADRRDVAVQTPYSPFGNKSDLNRYGDDGSAAILEASGVILWRTSDGVYRLLPNTQFSKPLFVSNSACIVWRDAYGTVTGKHITYFRVDSASGVLRESELSLTGIPLETASITTTSAPYILVNTDGTIYQMNFDASAPQPLKLLNTYADGFEETITVSADGSQVARTGDAYFWIRNDGAVKELTDAPFPLAAPNTIIRPVEISSSRFVFGLARTDLTAASTQTTLYSFSRTPGTDDLQIQPAITLPFPTGVTLGEVIQLPNFSQKGVEPVFVTQDRNVPTALLPINLCVFRLSGNFAVFLYKASFPLATFSQGFGVDVAVTRINATPGSESIALRDQTNHGVIWLHNGPGYDQWERVASTNFSRISKWKNDPTPAWATDPSPVTHDMTWGRPLFVTPGEVIVWQNALSAVLPNGTMPQVMVKHYGRNATTGALTVTEVKVVADATEPNAMYPGPLRGSQAFSPFPFTQDPALWMLETGEKLSSNSLRVRRYQLLNPINADADGDGIQGGSELAPFYVIPGAFTYAQAVEDAKRRGGKLATIADSAELTRMKTAITLWQRDGVMALPERTVPYPLWIGAYLDTTWKWVDGTNPALLAVPPAPLSNWEVGEPNIASPTYTRGRLTSAQKWEAVNPNQQAGYLLELTPTDPNSKDTDGDGASDYDELFRLITDPTVAGFGAGAPAPVNFRNPWVMGKYEGFLTQFGQGPIAGFTLSVTKTGSYTGKIYGVPGSASIRGSFASNGTVTALPVSLGSGFSTFLNMLIAPDPVTGVYRVSGQLTGLNGAPLVFELRRPGYSQTYPTRDAGLYTLALPAANVPKEGQPNGDGYLTGSIATNGVSSLRGKTSDGMVVSWSGNLLEGDFLSFYSMLKQNVGFVGSNLFLRDSALVDEVYGLVGESDIDGELRVARKAVTSGSAQIAGYDFHSGAYGSLYQPVAYSQLPAFSEFSVLQSNNAVIKFIDGVFSGQDVIATWTTTNAITIPSTQTRTLSARIATPTGTLTGTYRYNDPNQLYASTTGILGGVVLQKSGEVRGYYTAGTGSGQMLMLPNRDQTPAPVTLISPKSKNVSEDGATYKIYVTASEPWSVVNPYSWVVIFPTSGTGNAELVATVVGNSSNLRREANVTIAGLNHHIEQNWNSQGGGSGVTIAPLVGYASVGGGSYQVTITGYSTMNAADFFSPVSWVTITPDMQSATVVVEDWGFWNSGYTPRSAVIKIAGVNHTVIQDWK